MKSTTWTKKSQKFKIKVAYIYKMTGPATQCMDMQD